MKKILITGTSGFLGGEFLSFILKKNYQVFDLIRRKNKKKTKNYYPIYFKNEKDLKKKLTNKKFDTFINFSTFYVPNHNYNEISKIIEANILFPNLIVDIIHKKIKKVIFFGSMMEYNNSSDYNPQNFYAASKKAYNSFIRYYKNISNLKVFNIKLYETFSKNDKRKKIIPTILNKFKKNKKFILQYKNLKINAILSDDLNSFILKILKNKVKENTYILKNQKFINIPKLLFNIKEKYPHFKYEKGNSVKNIKNKKKFINCKIVNVKTNVLKKIINCINENNQN